jgi:hypothetical protein
MISYRRKTRPAIQEVLVAQKRIQFVSSTDNVPWGGAEEPSSRAARDFVSEGFAVAASCIAWSPPHPRVVDLPGGASRRGFNLCQKSQKRWLR